MGWFWRYEKDHYEVYWCTSRISFRLDNIPFLMRKIRLTNRLSETTKGAKFREIKNLIIIIHFKMLTSFFLCEVLRQT